MKAIVGLGNPGAKYRGTRHNIGFAVADEISRRAGLAFESAPADALIAKWRRPDGIAALLIKPMTFMNLSGQAVGRVGPVLQDRSRRPLDRGRRGAASARQASRPRARVGGRPQRPQVGHRAPRVGVSAIARRRGTGPDGPDGKARRDLADHVLARFDPDEAEEAIRMTARAADASEMFITSGIEAVMNAYNGGDPGGTE